MKLQTSTKTESKDFERVHIDEGIYEGTLKEVKDISEGQYGERVAFIYEVEGKELALVCSKSKATADNKIGQTLMAHGVEINDQEADTENLPQKTVKVWVEDYKVKDKDGHETGDVASAIAKVKALPAAVKEVPTGVN